MKNMDSENKLFQEILDLLSDPGPNPGFKPGANGSTRPSFSGGGYFNPAAQASPGVLLPSVEEEEEAAPAQAPPGPTADSSKRKAKNDPAVQPNKKAKRFFDHTKCAGPLDLSKITIDENNITPLYNGNPMKQKSDAGIHQGSVGAVAEWSDGTVSVIVKTLDESTMGSAKFKGALEGIEIAEQLAKCKLVSFVAHPGNKVRGKRTVITVMEKLTDDAFELKSKWKKNVPSEPEEVDQALAMIEFIYKLYECISGQGVTEGATYADMKLENIAYCSDDGEFQFRLIDIDSFNTTTHTFVYTNGVMDLNLATKYAFGVTAIDALFELPPCFEGRDFKECMSFLEKKSKETKRRFDEKKDPRYEMAHELIHRAFEVLRTSTPAS